MSGRTSHALVRQEIKATTSLLDNASMTESQARRVLSIAGELAQLAAWVAADTGLYRDAAKYAESGVVATMQQATRPWRRISYRR